MLANVSIEKRTTFNREIRVLRGVRLLAVAACLSFIGSDLARAHGDIHLQIEQINPQIEKTPTAALYLKRGELYRLDEDFKAALADFDQVERLDPTLDAI